MSSSAPSNNASAPGGAPPADSPTYGRAGMPELAAGAMHDIVQPIMAIMTRGNTALRLLQREPPDTEGAIQAIGRMVADGQRAADIVAWFRAAAAGIPLPRERLCLGQVVRDTLADVEHELRERAIRTELRMREAVTPVTGGCLPLRQVVANLVGNAMQAMEGTSGPRILSIALDIADGRAVLAVEDTGCGLARADIERLFDEFYSTREGGMGVGLSICRTIVAAHGGEIAAQQRSGGGARFVVRLPLAEEAHAARD
ncbi:sensor histidine kinase [Cupriavidus respiraculi]|uniref:sensor histidine kinase n=1 Tax=Cupriavidus respiraculi TaxID=195930 RepID=UPI001C94EC50|nr:sensor histidine kinase [Cupriavidus respiraculi]MBY4948009.1 sensor histidine kinase [Cupriavidus respiraculi]